MKCIFLLFFLVQVLGGAAIAAPGSPAVSPADEISQLEQSWATAALDSNEELQAQLLAPEFTLVTVRRASVTTAPRDACLADIRRTKFQVYSAKMVSVETYGDAAVATVDLTRTVDLGGPVGATDYFYLTDVWVKRSGRWQLVRRHSSPYPKTNGPAAVVQNPAAKSS